MSGTKREAAAAGDYGLKIMMITKRSSLKARKNSAVVSISLSGENRIEKIEDIISYRPFYIVNIHD